MSLKDCEFWFVAGSQHLYGPEVLDTVAEHSFMIAEALNRSPLIPCRIVFKAVVKTPEEITKLVKEANYDGKCAGIITWMHTFSPSKMWINGLSILEKPYCHFHTQFNRCIPNEEIDMDFMNLNQSAHGDREHGFIAARLRMPRKIVVGYWEDEDVQEKIGSWMRTAYGVLVSRSLKVMRFGDNMRQVAVTEGDKVEVQLKLAGRSIPPPLEIWFRKFRRSQTIKSTRSWPNMKRTIRSLPTIPNRSAIRQNAKPL